MDAETETQSGCVMPFKQQRWDWPLLVPVPGLFLSPLPDSWHCLMLTSCQSCSPVRTFQLGWGPGDTHSNHSVLFDFISFRKGRKLSFILCGEWRKKKKDPQFHSSLKLDVIPFPLNKIFLNFILASGLQKWKNNKQGVHLNGWRMILLLHERV